MLQMEKKMPEKLKEEKVSLTTIIRPSYWRNAYLLAGIEEEKEDQYKFRPTDEFWVDIGEIKDESTGAQK